MKGMLRMEFLPSEEKKWMMDLHMTPFFYVFIKIRVQGACFPSFHHWVVFFSLLIFFLF